MQQSQTPTGPGLVLTGGGARTAYQAGALQALGEILPQRQIPFRTICGTSAGALNAAYLASHAGNWSGATKGLAEIWRGLELKKVYQTNGISLSAIAMGWISRTVMGGKGGTRKSVNFLLDTSPLQELLSREIDFGQIRQSIASGALNGLSLSATQYFAQATVFFYDAHPAFRDWERSGRMGLRSELGVEHVMASSAIPIFFPPVQLGEHYFADGCLRQANPLSPAVHLGSDRILSIGIRTEKKKSKEVTAQVKRQSPSIAEISGEVLNALFLDSLDADVERLQRVNEAFDNMTPDLREAKFSSIRRVPILQLAPSRNLSDLLPNLTKKFPPTLRYLLHGLGASDKEKQGQEMLSYLAFFEEALAPLMALGYEDTIKRQGEIQAFMLADGSSRLPDGPIESPV